VLDAYLNPVLREYVARLRGSLGAGRLQIMTSAGGLIDADRFVGKDSILSGPAGGVIGFSRAAMRAGFAKAMVSTWGYQHRRTASTRTITNLKPGGRGRSGCSRSKPLRPEGVASVNSTA
jgi:hypothetical protein